MTIWRCPECNWIGCDSALLQAQNPFAPTETIVGCPSCKGIEAFVELCDEEGCQSPATCGCPTPTGYRRTCFEHSTFVKRKP